MFGGHEKNIVDAQSAHVQLGHIKGLAIDLAVHGEGEPQAEPALFHVGRFEDRFRTVQPRAKVIVVIGQHVHGLLRPGTDGQTKSDRDKLEEDGFHGLTLAKEKLGKIARDAFFEAKQMNDTQRQVV